MDWTAVTEYPGLGVSQEQLSMAATRYRLAESLGRGGAVLEAACGPGVGLEYLAGSARFVVGGDLEPKNARAAQDLCRGHPNIRITMLDGGRLPFRSASFDAVLILDSIYWLPDQTRFFVEAARVLRPGGQLLVTTVNRHWRGFNPHPAASRYLDAEELQQSMEDAGFEVTLKVGFDDVDSSARDRAVALIRALAVRLHMIPTVNERKEWIKKLFYGRLVAMPDRVNDKTAPAAPLRDVSQQTDWGRTKIIYAVGARR